MLKHFGFAKLDERSGIVSGVMTAELADKDGEVFDYDGGGKDEIQAWSDRCVATTRAAGQELSLGNVRWQHDPMQIAGKVTEIQYDNQARTVRIETLPVNDDYRRMIREGFARGFSIAGDYKSRRCSECGADMGDNHGNDCWQCGKWVLVKFVPQLVEVSYVDAPCLAEAVFEVVKSDGSSEFGRVPRKEHNMSLKQHLADCHKSRAKWHAKAAAIEEASGNRAMAKHHREAADTENAHAAALDEVDEGGQKVAKGAGGDFFDRFLYKGSMSDEAVIQAAHDAAGLFK